MARVEGVAPWRLFRIALLACLVAAALGAAPLAAWIDASVAAGTIVQQAADNWSALTQRLGFGRPYDALRGIVRAAEGPH